jgi:hypothetical protein
MENVQLIIKMNVNVMMDGKAKIVGKKLVQNYVNNVMTVELVDVKMDLLDDIVR